MKNIKYTEEQIEWLRKNSNRKFDKNFCFEFNKKFCSMPNTARKTDLAFVVPGYSYYVREKYKIYLRQRRYNHSHFRHITNIAIFVINKLNVCRRIFQRFVIKIIRKTKKARDQGDTNNDFLQHFNFPFLFFTGTVLGLRCRE